MRVRIPRSWAALSIAVAWAWVAGACGVDSSGGDLAVDGGVGDDAGGGWYDSDGGGGSKPAPDGGVGDDAGGGWYDSDGGGGDPCDFCDIPPPGAAAAGVSGCCGGDQTCGLQTSLSAECLPLDAPGGVDLACPDFELTGGVVWSGCCTPEGRCGALGASARLGCIDNAALGAPEASCTYDPENTCEAILVVTCDGREDCPSDHECCGEWNAAYRRLSCIEGGCAEAQASRGGVWSEICHPGDTCSQSGFECRETPTLPDGIYRCRDTGAPSVERGSTARDEINCGGVVCGAGETCCVPTPGDAHCVAASEPCQCRPAGPRGETDAGAKDAGAGDAG